MKSSEEFNAFYNSELKRSVEQLEEKRKILLGKYSFKKYWRNLKWLLILTVLGGVARAAAPDYVPEQVGLIAVLMIGYGIIGGIYLLVKRAKAFSPVVVEYKKSVITKVVQFVDSGLSYDPKQGIGSEEFSAGEIFERHRNFRSEDLVQGTINGVKLRMSDVYCTKRNDRTDSNDSKSITLFRGFYVIAHFGQPFSAQVILKPSTKILESLEKLGGMAKQIFGGLVQTMLERMNLSEIQTGHEEFDKAYFVHSSDRDKALTLLTPTLMQLILTFNKELDIPVSMSFINDQLHLAFGHINMFEAQLNESFIEKDISKKYFTHLNLALGLVEGVKTLR